MRLVDFVVDTLMDHGSDQWFVLTGNGSMYLNDAMAKRKDLKYVSARNEAAAPMMAEAYSRLTNKIGVVCVTAGPGSTNAIPGLAEAYWDSAPILIISGQNPVNQINSKLRTYGTAGFDIVPSVKSMTKYAVTVNNPHEIKYHIEKALHLASSGRPGPVWIDLPMDVQFAEINPNELDGFDDEIVEKKITSDEIQQIYNLLNSAHKPLLIAGHGVRIADAKNELLELIDLLKIPVVTSRLGKDLIGGNHRYNFGQPGLKGEIYSPEILKTSDLILSLGCRLPVQMIGDKYENFNENAKIIMIDIDNDEIINHKSFINFSLNVDVKKFIFEMISNSKLYNNNVNDWYQYCANLKSTKTIDSIFKKSNPIDLYYFMSRLDALSPEGTVFITDAGSNYYVGGQVYKYNKENQREITAGTSAAMGLSIPLAIGSAYARPNDLIMAVTGDGSLELNVQELKTISYNQLNIKLFVINNGGYASMKEWQDTYFEGTRVGVGTGDTFSEMLNLKKISEAFDMPYIKIDDYKEIDNCVQDLINKKGPMFIEVMTDENGMILLPYNNKNSSVLS
ncbi:thiamine pyrophosphate-binding protein [Pelagibacteraceae bacterium]|nr:thiamine pyrophosphate-binding protein [Pelagibacteraceae bacterium]